MIVRDQTCIEHVRHQANGRCEYCGAPGNHVHHIWAKGMGGAPLDIPINLINLCNNCHTQHHSGNCPKRMTLIQLIEWREGWNSEQIEEEIYRVRQLPKGSEYSPPRPFATYNPYRRDGHSLQRDADTPGVGCGRQGVAFDAGGWFGLS